jgi:hypothetical protein
VFTTWANGIVSGLMSVFLSGFTVPTRSCTRDTWRTGRAFVASSVVQALDVTPTRRSTTNVAGPATCR